MSRNKWREHQKAAREGGLSSAPGIKLSTTVIQISDVPSWKEERLTTLKTLLSQRREREGRMKLIEANELERKMNGETANLPALQAELVETCDLVGSESMKVLDSSITQLHDQMKNSHPLEAVMLASTIGKLIRLKLDIRRTKRE